MANKDRSERGKEQIAYFVPKTASSYKCLGNLGHPYYFTKDNPVKVTLAPDIRMFRSRQDVLECDKNGRPLAEVGETKQPLSYSTTDSPSSPSSEVTVLVGDKIPAENEEDTEEEEKEEKPKKKKKKKSSDKKKETKKKKKKSKKDKSKEDEDDFEEDWDEDD